MAGIKDVPRSITRHRNIAPKNANTQNALRQIAEAKEGFYTNGKQELIPPFVPIKKGFHAIA